MIVRKRVFGHAPKFVSLHSENRRQLLSERLDASGNAHAELLVADKEAEKLPNRTRKKYFGRTFVYSGVEIGTVYVPETFGNEPYRLCNVGFDKAVGVLESRGIVIPGNTKVTIGVIQSYLDGQKSQRDLFGSDLQYQILMDKRISPLYKTSK